MEERYERNIPAVSPEEQELLRHKRALVVGCGGLGGYVIEYLARMGVGELTVVDGDVFEPSNMNRQLNSAPDVLGKSKAVAAAERVRRVNPAVRVTPVEAFFAGDNADALVAGQDVVLDALDNLPARLLLEDECERHGVWLIHGAIQGWSLQATSVRPGSRALHFLYESGLSTNKTSLPFTPPCCAAIECAEAVKLLCTGTTELDGVLLLGDLRQMEWQRVTL